MTSIIPQSKLLAGQPGGFVVQAAGVSPVVGPAKATSFLDRKHAVYLRLSERWAMVRDFYEGEVAGEDCAKQYIQKRFQGETDEAYTERVRLADYTPHLGTLIDSLAGMLFAVEARASRTWSKDKDSKGALGDPSDPQSPAAALWRNATGKGEGWATLWRQFALDVIAYQRMWVLIDTTDGGRPVVKLISPLMVPNWTDTADGVTEVLLKETRVPKSLEDEALPECYVVFRPEGWIRYEKDDDGAPREIGRDTYDYQDEHGNLILPIFPIELPLRRYIGWLLAKKANIIFNQESVRDFALRSANFARLILGIETQEQFDKLGEALKRGQMVLPEAEKARGGHRYIAPPSEPVAIATEVLTKKIEDFFVAGFKLYGDAAREKTATEIKQDVAAGVGAFLQLLKVVVDDAENGAFWRLEQLERPGDPGLWGQARVERSDDFANVDLASVLDEMRKRYLGQAATVPVGRKALIQLATESARYDGLPVDEAEITAAVDAQLYEQMLGMLEQLGAVPPLVRARLSMRIVAALGLVDATEEVETAEGEKVSLLEQLEGETLELAMAKDEQARREAEAQIGDPGSGLQARASDWSPEMFSTP